MHWNLISSCAQFSLVCRFQKAGAGCERFRFLNLNPETSCKKGQGKWQEGPLALPLLHTLSQAMSCDAVHFSPL